MISTQYATETGVCLESLGPVLYAIITYNKIIVPEGTKGPDQRPDSSEGVG